MSSAELIPVADFLVDFVGAAGDFFSGLSFFLGSLDAVSALFPAACAYLRQGPRPRLGWGAVRGSASGRPRRLPLLQERRHTLDGLRTAEQPSRLRRKGFPERVEVREHLRGGELLGFRQPLR